MTDLYYPLHSLREGHWFKLICGASFQHLPVVRNITLAYTLAGVDCIDVAADPAVIAAAQDGLTAAAKLGEEAAKRGLFVHQLSERFPWLMVSLNDGEDPHFRKAEFDPDECPANCHRPCETICPASAITFSRETEEVCGVIDQRCYGCGRCVTVCPKQLIYTRSYVSAPEAIAPLVLQAGVDALEIHTKVGRLEDFKRLWKAIAPWVNQLKLLSLSCADGDGLIEYLWAIYHLVSPLPCPLVWQTDGRPMSGDIGAGTTREAITLAGKVLAANLPGYVQLAGGTNNHTVAKLNASGLMNRGAKETQEKTLIPPSPCIAGVAYGSYARVLMSPILDELEKLNKEQLYDHRSIQNSQLTTGHLEDVPSLLWQAVELAHSLVSQIKSSIIPNQQPLPK